MYLYAKRGNPVSQNRRITEPAEIMTPDSQALLAPQFTSAGDRPGKGRRTIRFRDRKIDDAKRGLIQQHTGPGELSFDNIMQLRFSRTMRNLLVPLAFVSSVGLLCVYYSGVFGLESFEVLSDLVNHGAAETASRISSGTDLNKSTNSTQIGSFARLTIEHCPEPVLWAPILIALSINLLAHIGLLYQCRNVGLLLSRIRTSNSESAHAEPRLSLIA